MFRAMTLKELREIRGIVIGAMIVYGIITIAAIDPRSPLNLLSFLDSNMSSDSVPFVRDSFGGKFYFFAALVTILLGFWQTFGESTRGTYPFLLHRPASIRWLIGVKLFVGLTVYLIITAIPLLIYSIWAATPGTHASPFAWSMTMPAWVAWFTMTILYLGSFLTGIIPGRWYGARFLPLAAAAFVSFMLLILNSELGGVWWPCGIVLVVDLWLITLILFVAKSRDYS